MVKKTTAWTVLIYGLIVIGAGYLGYAQGGSQVSMYSGLGFGVLLIISSVLMFFELQFGAYASLILTLCLAGTFATRYSISGSGLMATLAVLSGGVLLFLLGKTIHWKR